MSEARMPTTLPSPVDRGQLRFVAVDAAGAVWRWIDDEMVWVRQAAGPKAEGGEDDGSAVVYATERPRPRRAPWPQRGSRNRRRIGNGGAGRRVRLLAGVLARYRKVCGTSGVEPRETRGDAVGAIRGRRTCHAEMVVGPSEGLDRFTCKKSL